MAPNDTSASAAEVYDRYLAPMVYEPYARHLAARVAVLRPVDVLEINAHTGMMTQELARRLPDARIVATDINQDMINHAARLRGDPRITWRQADPQALPFGDASFDAVVCQFGVMYIPEKVKAFREARRVLRPGGVFLFNVWDRIEANHLADVVMQAVAALYPDDLPMFLVNARHGYHDRDEIRADLGKAGFTRVTSVAVEQSGEARDARAAAIALFQGTPLRAEIEARGLNLEAATDAAAAAIAARFGSGPVAGLIRALVVEAR